MGLNTLILLRWGLQMYSHSHWQSVDITLIIANEIVFFAPTKLIISTNFQPEIHVMLKVSFYYWNQWCSWWGCKGHHEFELDGVKQALDYHQEINWSYSMSLRHSHICNLFIYFQFEQLPSDEEPNNDNYTKVQYG